MKLCTSAQMRDIDNYAINVLGIPGTELMENAAGHIADEALKQLKPGGRVAVVCGTGNNGGDGICAATILMEKGIAVRVFLTGDREKLTPDSREMSRRFAALGGSLERFSDCNDVENYLQSCDVIIDAMFGIGLHSNLRSDALRAVELINTSGAYVIAVDMPSGVHTDSGAVMGAAVKADKTITFSMAKLGQHIEPGCSYCGEILVKDIGIPFDVWYAILGDDCAAEQDALKLSSEVLKTNSSEIRFR